MDGVFPLLPRRPLQDAGFAGGVVAAFCAKLLREGDLLGALL